jgi:hypothetical protein
VIVRGDDRGSTRQQRWPKHLTRIGARAVQATATDDVPADGAMLRRQTEDAEDLDGLVAEKGGKDGRGIVRLMNGTGGQDRSAPRSAARRVVMSAHADARW